jgi:hypothetical protein
MNMVNKTLLHLVVMAASLACLPAIAAKPGDAEAIPHLDSRGK